MVKYVFGGRDFWGENGGGGFKKRAKGLKMRKRGE